MAQSLIFIKGANISEAGSTQVIPQSRKSRVRGFLLLLLLQYLVFSSPDVLLSSFTAGSSTDVSEDWEKDFDLDMTEEEVQMALSKADATAEVLPLEPVPLQPPYRNARSSS